MTLVSLHYVFYLGKGKLLTEVSKNETLINYILQPEK